MKFGRTLLLVLLLIALLGVLPVLAVQETENTVEYVSDVNPMYADVYVPEEDIDLSQLPAALADTEYLSKEEAADVIREQMLARSASFSVGVLVDYDTALDRQALWKELLYAAMEHTGEPAEGDYLYSHYSGGNGRISYSYDDAYYYLNFTYILNYKTTVAQEAEVDAAVETVLASLELDSKTRYQKVCAIYDYLTENVDYDYEDLENEADLLKYAAYGALIEKTCVCQGYSSAFYRLCLEAGIDARMIRGTANNGQTTGGHAWNIVQLGDSYYYLDATWDEPRADLDMAYEYFLVGSTDFEVDHFADAEYKTPEFCAEYPISTVDYTDSEPEKFELEGITMTLGNRLDMNFVIDTAKLEGDGHYAVIVKSYADGKTTKVTVDQADWENFDGADWYYFTFSGVAAKEMTDTITVNVYNADGEQVTYEWVDSVEAYCIRMLPQAASEEEATLYVDMLNYGAAAQSYFGYKTDDLANADLTAEQQAKATQSVSMENKLSSGNGYVGSALTLESCIQLDIVFDGSQIEGAATAVATYTDHYGAAQRVEYEKFGEYAAGMPMISLTGMSVADCSQMVTLSVYDAEGNVLSTVEDSVESYVARMTESDPLFETIMKFATSSYNYFH